MHPKFKFDFFFEIHIFYLEYFFISECIKSLKSNFFRHLDLLFKILFFLISGCIRYLKFFFLFLHIFIFECQRVITMPMCNFKPMVELNERLFQRKSKLEVERIGLHNILLFCLKKIKTECYFSLETF